MSSGFLRITRLCFRWRLDELHLYSASLIADMSDRNFAQDLARVTA